MFAVTSGAPFHVAPLDLLTPFVHLLCKLLEHVCDVVLRYSSAKVFMLESHTYHEVEHLVLFGADHNRKELTFTHVCFACLRPGGHSRGLCTNPTCVACR